jgi:hypothetical protein
MRRLLLASLIGTFLLAAPGGAEARWTAWKISGVEHESTWDWRETATNCVSADPVVLSEQGSKRLLSLTPTQVHRVARKRDGRSVPGLAGGILHQYGPFGVIEGRGRAAVHAVQVVQPCGITGYDAAGDPLFGPTGPPVTDTCDDEVDARFDVLGLLPLQGRLGRTVAVRLIEDIGAEPDCAGSSGLGVLGPEPLRGSIPLELAPLRRFFTLRTTIEFEHTRGRIEPEGQATVVGTTTTRARASLRRFTRPERCFYGRKVPAVVKRKFVCTPR